MTHTSFVFRTAADHAATGDLDTVLREALDPDGLDFETRVQMLTGIATRPDLNAKTFTTLLNNLPHEGWTALAAILNNPVLRRSPKVFTQARRTICGDAFPAILRIVDDPAEFLPDMLAATTRHSMFPGLPAMLRDQFTPTQINQAVADMVATYMDSIRTASLRDPGDYSDRDLTHAVPLLAFLTTDQITGILATIKHTITTTEPIDDVAFYDFEDALSRFATRPDLTVGHGHLIFDSIDRLVSLERDAYNRMVRDASEAGLNHYPPFRGRSLRILHDNKLPQSVLSRALTSPVMFEALRENRNFHLGLRPATVNDALLNGADPSVLNVYSVYNISADALTAVLDYLDHAWGPTPVRAEVTNQDRDILTNAIQSASDLIGTPQWDRLYDLWTRIGDTTAPDGSVQQAFINLTETRSTRWSDPSATPILHRLAAWASVSTDPYLRRHALKYVWGPEQLAAATADPSPLVRVSILDHETVPEAVLLVLAADTDVTVRLATAQHDAATSGVLDLLHEDPDARVRLAVAGHDNTSAAALRTMAEDPDDMVRATVTERFMTALAATPATIPDN